MDLKKHFKILGILVSAFSLVSCGGGGSSTPTGTASPPPVIQTPVNFSAEPLDGNVSITWQSQQANYKFDLYVATEKGLNYKNYSTFENSQWLTNVTSPYTFTPTDYSKLYFFTVVAKSGTNESEQSTLVSAAPRYIEDGQLVSDLQTSLIWQRCAIGQTWSSSTNNCEGEALRLTHQETLNKLSEYGEGWRIPTANELISLVYCSNGTPVYFITELESKCESTELNQPTIYTNVFVNTLTQLTPYYRTSTRYPSPEGFSNSVFYELIDFSSGGTSQTHASEPVAFFVRLVKTK